MQPNSIEAYGKCSTAALHRIQNPWKRQKHQQQLQPVPSIERDMEDKMSKTNEREKKKYGEPFEMSKPLQFYLDAEDLKICLSISYRNR